MKRSVSALLALASAIAMVPVARAGTVAFSFSGGGITAEGTLTLGPSLTVVAVSGPNATANEITGITGWFTDTNIGLSAAITGLFTPISYTYTAGSIAFSPAGNSYDDLYYPGGDSPLVCPPPDPYPFSGGVFDIFGVLFNIDGGDVGELWSNGIIPPDWAPTYGAAVSLGANDIDYQGNLVPTPEPGSVFLLATGLVGFVALLARKKSLLPMNLTR